MSVHALSAHILWLVYFTSQKRRNSTSSPVLRTEKSGPVHSSLKFENVWKKGYFQITTN